MSMATEKKVRGVTIRLYKGDITDYDGDAVVNAANNYLWMGSGVAGAIKRKGGVEIEREAVAKGPINVGEAVVTDAGQLNVDYVIHAAVMGQDLTTNERFIREATTNSLFLCDELGVKRVAFPAFGTGVGGFPLRECAKAMLEEVVLYLKEEDTNLEEIAFYLYGDEAFRAFSDVLESLETDPGSGQ